MSTEPLAIKWKLFRPWLESKGDDHVFDYRDTQNCLISQFARETHGEEVICGSHTVTRRGELVSISIPHDIREAAHQHPWTVGTVRKYLNRYFPERLSHLWA